ncbi:hypothetical protein Tco_1247577 [Tanacetum coccineum]
MSLEKQDLQAKLENERAINAKWTSSSKNLVKLIDSSMTVRTKIGLGFDEYIGENELGWDDSEFSVFTPTPEDVEGKPLYNRFVKTDRMKAVPPPLSGNYIPLSDPTDLDESQMTYGPKQTHTSDSEPKTSDLDSCESNSSVESLESMPKPVIIEPKTSEYASCKSNLSAESPEFFPKSVCARNESVRKADNPRKNNKSPRGNKRSWNGMMTQKLGENFEFNNKACYVCGRFSHLHYTCKNKRKVNDQKQVTPVWNNSRRVNHQLCVDFLTKSKSNIVHKHCLTKSGLVYVNSLKRLFHKKTPNYNRYFNRSVNSVKDTRVHTARPKTEVNTVKASASWVWKPKQEVIDHVSKSNNASKTLTRYDYVDAYGRFQNLFVGPNFCRKTLELPCPLDVSVAVGLLNSPMFYVPRVEMVINPPWEQTLSGSQGLASPEQTATVENGFSPPWIIRFLGPKDWLVLSKRLQLDWLLIHQAEVVPKSVAGSSFPAASSTAAGEKIQDYALWDVIENGDSWVSVPQTAQENGTSVTKMSIPVTAEEKTNKKNDVKARSLLLMTMFAAIETRFGGNAATKKTQKTLLKQQYENFQSTSVRGL